MTATETIQAAHTGGNPTPMVELLTFTMREQFYAVEIMKVREIRGWSKPTPLPHSPSHVRGVINLRGTVLPILDLSARLHGLEAEASERNVIIVIERGDQVAGLLVDAVSDILSVEADTLQPPPDMKRTTQDNCIEAICVIEDAMIRQLNLGTVLVGSGDIAA